MSRYRKLGGFVLATGLILSLIAAPSAPAQASPPRPPTAGPETGRTAAPLVQPASASPKLAAPNRGSGNRRRQLGAIAGALFVVLALTLWSFDFGLLGGKAPPLSRPLAERRSRPRQPD